MKWSLLIFNIYLGFCYARHTPGIIDEEKCNKLGGPGTYEKLKFAGETSRTCINELSDKATTIHRTGIAGILDKFVPKHENSIKDVSVCLKDYVKTAELCLTKEEKQYFYERLETLSRGVDSVYENDGQEIIDYMEKGGIGCVPPHIGEVIKCYIDHSPCKDFELFKDCIVEGLNNNCANIDSADITEELLEYVKSSMCMDNKLPRSRSLKRIVRGVKGMENHIPHITQTVRKKCYLNEETDRKLEESLNKTEICIKEKRPFLTKKEVYLAHLDNCTTATVQMFTDCLPEDLKYIPKLLLNIVHSLVAFLYDDFILIEEVLGPCMGKLNTTESENNYDSCISGIGVQDDVPTSKEKFCKHFIAESECFTKQVNETCVHSDKVDRFIKDFNSAMERPCNSTK